MLAYMNEEAYQKTLEAKETWFYSRSRQELWHKGGTSGNYQAVVDLRLDCDGDTLLIRVEPKGPACHTGKRSCFFNSVDTKTGAITEQEKAGLKDDSSADRTIYREVMDGIDKRKRIPAENSYTNYLFEKGIDKIGKKVIEEAGEVVIAAKNQDKNEVINEVSDLLYHSFVLLAEQDVSLEDVEEELRNRFSKKGNHKGERPPIKEW